MLLIALIAVAIQVWSESWFTIVFIDVVVACLSVEVLRRNLPRSVRTAIATNCRRPDGSWSPRRERAENKAVRKLQCDLLVVVVVVLLATNALIWTVDSEVIPLSIGMDAVGSFRLTGWRESLADEVQQFELWGQQQRMSSAEVETRKRILWQCWPAFILIGLGWMALAFSIVQAAYFFAIKELADSIRNRAEQYRTLDVSRAQSAHFAGLRI